ncbi:MAG: ABC transporter permease, partial [Prosthecobacter sp.]
MNFWKEQLSRLAALLVLAVFFSVMTQREEFPQDAAAARELVSGIAKDAKVMIAVRGVAEDKAFAEALKTELSSRAVEVVTGEPRDARKALDRVSATGLDVIIGTQVTAEWLVFSDLKDVTILKPSSRTWPVFLTRENLLNIASQIAVIAILAIGMTLVIIAGGIDLSVGSLLALSAVVTTLLIQEYYGGSEKAGPAQMVMASICGMMVCACSGLLAGGIITRLRMPPFIVTLAMMLVGSGMAYRLADNQSVYQVPESFVWLGRGADLMNVPNAVVLMLLLYAVA